MWKFFKLQNANDGKYKMEIYFINNETKKLKKIKFGSYGSSTYLDHKNNKIKENYIKRHRVNEDWSDPYSRGALSLYLLWNKKTLEESLTDYLYKFDLL